MAVPRTKYSMQVRIRYKGNLVDVLDRIRAIRMVLMVHIEQDLGKGAELITIKVMTPYPPRKTFFKKNLRPPHYAILNLTASNTN